MANSRSNPNSQNHHELRDSLHRFVNAEGESSISSQIKVLENIVASIKNNLIGAELVIAGIELTQATQYFSINGQGSEYAPDNSVPLIAQRALILRVYINDRRESQEFALLPKYVGGRITVHRVNPYGPDQHVATLSPINGPIRTRSSAAIDRGDSDQTLNFRLRPALCYGNLRFRVSILEQPPVFDNPLSMAARTLTMANFPPVGPIAFQSPAGTTEVTDGVAPPSVASPEGPSPTAVIHGRFDPVPTFRVRAVLIHYTGDGMDIPAPSGLDFAQTFDYVLRTYPIGRLEFSDCVEVEYDGDLSAPGGGCGPGWGGLLELLYKMAALSDDNDIYVALVPRNVNSPYTLGCGNTGVAASIDQDGNVMAQEIGHALSRKHAPSGGAAGADPDFPTYNSFPSGSIGEYGFDAYESNIFDPASTFDFMGYSNPQWISPYTYIGLRNAIVERFGVSSMANLTNRTRRDVLFLNFNLNRDGTVDMLPSFHVASREQLARSDFPSDIGVELLDKSGRVLNFHRCRRTKKPQDEDGPYVVFQETIPWIEQAIEIRILRNQEILNVLEIEKSKPSVKIKAKKIRNGEKIIKLAWFASSGKHKLTYIVRYSNNGGTTWRVVSSNFQKTEFRANMQNLPGGESCMFQILATSGIRTSVTQTETFSSPIKPRTAEILSPAPNSEISEYAGVVLRGGAFSPDFGLGVMEDVLWVSNLDGRLGEGITLTTNNLSVGFHTITLNVPDGVGGVATASVSIRIGGGLEVL